MGEPCLPMTSPAQTEVITSPADFATALAAPPQKNIEKDEELHDAQQTTSRCPADVRSCKNIDIDELQRHSSAGDCWVAVRGNVYDVTNFLSQHPGGAAALSRPGRAGTDVTAHFLRIGHSSYAEQILQTLQIGQLARLPQQRLLEATAVKDVGDPVALSNSGWHALRREAILKEHAEVQDLLTEEPLTLVLIPLLAFAYAGACLFAQQLQPSRISQESMLKSVGLVIVLAYTIGSFLKMWQFAVAHEVCHGNVTHCLERNPFCKAVALHMCSVPAIGSHIHDYYTWQHLGHHASFGERQATTALHETLLMQTYDGDVFSVNSAALLTKRGFEKQMFPNFRERLHRSPYVGLIIVDGIFHLLHLIHILYFNVRTSVPVPSLDCLCFFPTLCFSMCFSRKNLTGESPHTWRQFVATKLFGRSAASLSDRDAMTLLSSTAHLVGHFWLWLAVDVSILMCGPRTFQSILLGSLYLLLSELFFFGFGFHPYLAFWLGTHCTGAGVFSRGSQPDIANDARCMSQAEAVKLGKESEPSVLASAPDHLQGSIVENHASVRNDCGNTVVGVSVITSFRRVQNLQQQQDETAMKDMERNESVRSAVPPSGVTLRQFSTGAPLVTEGGEIVELCQPTMSTYSWASGWLTANLTYHVEHHDFPKCPWTKLPQIRKLAPEFYFSLKSSGGFRHTLREYLRHGHSWNYGCFD